MAGGPVASRPWELDGTRAPVRTPSEADDAMLRGFSDETSCASLGSADETSCGTTDSDDSMTGIVDIILTSNQGVNRLINYAMQLQARS